jgi:FAD/FMN-containing dehydrogenase
MRAPSSWGKYPAVADQRVHRLRWRDEPWPAASGTLLPRGLGRSYGDSCLNAGGTLLETLQLDHIVRFDRAQGLLCCEAGTSLAAVLDLILPAGWFLPVTPGTRQVTVGGCLANDVHGKNHHRAGAFGCFVERFELARSDGRRLICSPTENPELFRATIGGLGLTGLVTWVEFRLRRIAGPWIDHESIRFGGLDEFFALAAESDQAFEYTVAWIDCLARGPRLGRGLFLRGNHSPAPGPAARPRSGRLGIPFDAPELLLNRATLGAFNGAYYWRQLRRVRRGLTHAERFFYPLDGIADWNRLYGRRGLLQYQCVVPHAAGPAAVRALVERVAASGEGSFLAVLKIFGDRPSPGLLSFPRPGVTLALDFPNRGASTLALLERLDQELRGTGGRVYPAKDARMSAASFQAYYPAWRELERWIDPAFSSSFWRRVTRGEQAA